MRRSGSGGGGFTALDAEEDEDEDEYARESWNGSLTGSPRKRAASSDGGSDSGSSSTSGSGSSSDEDGSEAGDGALPQAAGAADTRKPAAEAPPARGPTPPPVAIANGNGAHASVASAAAAPLGRRSLLPPAPPTGPGETLVDSVFGGVLVSTVVCSACDHSSVSYEPFLDLSLPIPAAQGALIRKDSLLSRLASLGKPSKPKADGDEGAAQASPGKEEEDGEEGGAKKKSSPKVCGRMGGCRAAACANLGVAEAVWRARQPTLPAAQQPLKRKPPPA